MYYWQVERPSDTLDGENRSSMLDRSTDELGKLLVLLAIRHHDICIISVRKIGRLSNPERRPRYLRFLWCRCGHTMSGESVITIDLTIGSVGSKRTFSVVKTAKTTTTSFVEFKLSVWTKKITWLGQIKVNCNYFFIIEKITENT